MQEYIRPKRKSDNVQKKSHVVRDTVLLGDWEKIEKQSARTINPKLDDEILDGLIIKGYEMKWGKTNENGEQYDKTAFDEFIQQYFVEGKLNMPVDINHGGYHDWRNYCGRVLYIETNSVGFYFVVYVPKTYAEYDRLLWGLENGIIQGFSKEGWAEEWEPRWKEDGTFDYELIKKMKVLSVSLVSTPANGLDFERIQEIRNSLVFKNTNKIENKGGKTFAELFK